MKIVCAVAFAVVASSVLLGAQETKKVPKDSVRVSVTGCTHDYIFTAGPRMEGQQESGDIPEGMHLRMNAPKKMISEIHAHEGSKVMITGLMLKGQRRADGVGIGGGVRIGPASPGSRVGGASGVNQNVIDVEGWRPLPGDCPL